jgi:hypothetical protein
MKIVGNDIYISPEDRNKQIDFENTRIKEIMKQAIPVLQDYDFENVYIENVIQQLAKDGYILPNDGYVDGQIFWGAATTYILGRKGMKFVVERVKKEYPYPLKDYKFKYRKGK